jgi:hypothetical protein
LNPCRQLFRIEFHPALLIAAVAAARSRRSRNFRRGLVVSPATGGSGRGLPLTPKDVNKRHHGQV